MKKIAVFCGSRKGTDPSFITLAQNLGKKIAENNFGLVYGGAQIGLMGEVADAVLALNGKVWGVMPKCLSDREIDHHHLTELIIADSMHERKQKMYDLADAYIAMPGGIGTLDEICEVITWSHIGIHAKPIYLLNYKNFYMHFWQQLKLMSEMDFISAEQLSKIKIVTNVDEIINELK